jgi:hypothetical protein
MFPQVIITGKRPSWMRADIWVELKWPGPSTPKGSEGGNPHKEQELEVQWLHENDFSTPPLDPRALFAGRGFEV